MADAVGSEILPGIGGCFAAGKNWIFFYPQGPAHPGSHVYRPGVSGTAIAGTSWERLIVATENGVELWRPWDLTEPEDYCYLPFACEALIPFYDDLMLAVSSDGVYTLLELTNTIEPTVIGILKNARNVRGGYFKDGATKLLNITGDVDAVYQYEFEEINDIQQFTFLSRTTVSTLKDLIPYGINAANAPGGAYEFKATEDPLQDSKIAFAFERRTAVGIRYGFMVAHSGTGLLSVVVDDLVSIPVGITFPFFPVADVRFDFRGPVGGLDFVDRDTTSRGETTVPITERQVIEAVTVGWSPGDEVIISGINEPLAVPCAILIEHAQGIELADVPLDRVVKLIEIGDPEFFRIDMTSDATLTVNDYEFYLDGAAMTVIAAAADAYGAATPNAPLSAYHLTLINFKQDSVDVWQDGVLLRSDSVTYPSGALDISVFKLFTDISGSSVVFASLSDVRLFIDQVISDEQAKALSGGEVTF